MIDGDDSFTKEFPQSISNSDKAMCWGAIMGPLSKDPTNLSLEVLLQLP